MRKVGFSSELALELDFFGIKISGFFILGQIGKSRKSQNPGIGIGILCFHGILTIGIIRDFLKISGIQDFFRVSGYLSPGFGIFYLRDILGIFLSPGSGFISPLWPKKKFQFQIQKIYTVNFTGILALKLLSRTKIALI